MTKLTREILDYCAIKSGATRKDLVERDLILHFILSELCMDKNFSKDYAFKGGTCLTKCHLGYYRFSEDLDFTYLQQKRFDKKTKSQVRKTISEELEKVIHAISKIAESLSADFSKDKSKNKYFEFGDGNRFTTIKIWYNSLEENKESFIKIQINFIENIIYPTIKKKATTLISIKKDFLAPENSEWIFSVPIVECYDIREILCEKVRAITTRKGVKSRDFIDIYMIEKKADINFEKYNNEIISKIKYALDNSKYRDNLKRKKESAPKFTENEEKGLMLVKLENEFYTDFIERFYRFMEHILEQL